MPPIKLRCPRCGCRLTVPEHKAGKRGKCPTCGGPIKVPTLDEAQRAQAQHQLPSWAVGFGLAAAIAVLFVVAVLLFRAGGNESVSVSGTSQSGADIPEEDMPLEDQLRRILGIEARLQSYQGLLKAEQFLHVRAINAKLHSYEQLAPEELRFRDEMMEVWRTDADAAPDLSMVNTPLSEIEKGKHRQIMEDLREESDEILRAMRSAGAGIHMSPDPFGKNVLDLGEAREKLADLRAKFQEGSSSPE